ncbi:MAG: 30S ribosomal protein S4 [Verrucomicrobia bacterium]|nr:MAG: 30S ribosomal protein S4 [Verrucomicrobiota bacterium]
MGRYTGPKTKVSRRYGVPIFGSSKSLERKNYPPGMHGPRGSRRKQSDYAIALGEKQKLRYQYGLLERQFRRIFQNALRKRGVTGETLLQLLETRIDNVVYRLGLANTRSAARQLVSHGHVLVNGRSVNIASYNVKAGDEITIRSRRPQRQSRAHPVTRRNAANRKRTTHRRTVFAVRAPRHAFLLSGAFSG